MKIGFDAKRLFNNFTGLGNYSRFIVSALSDHYPDNHYVLYTPRLKRNAETERFFDTSKFNIQTPGSLQKLPVFNSIWRSWKLGDRAANDGIELFHGLSHELPVTKPKKLKTVVTIHDLIFLRYPEFYNAIDTRIYLWKIKRACESSDQIIAISEQTKEDLIQFIKAEPSKISVVYQGCSLIFKKDYSDEQKNYVINKYDLPSNFLLNVGTIERRKNALLLIDALNQMKHKIPVVLVGRETNYAKEVHRAIARHNLRSLVKFIPAVSFQDLPIIYQAAEIFVYPSLFEGFGIPILEAIASGTPVVTSTGSCFKEAGGPNSIYINSNDSDQLADTLDNLLDDETKRASMITHSREYINKFEPAEIAKEMMRVYEKIS